MEPAGRQGKALKICEDDQVKGRTEVILKRKPAFVNEVDEAVLNKQGITEFGIEGLTQMILLVNENRNSLHFYNDLHVTNQKVEKDEEMTVRGIYYGEEVDAVLQLM